MTARSQQAISGDCDILGISEMEEEKEEDDQCELW